MDDMRNGRVDESHMLNLEGILLTLSHYHTNRYEGVFFFMEEYI